NIQNSDFEIPNSKISIHQSAIIIPKSSKFPLAGALLLSRPAHHANIRPPVGSLFEMAARVASDSLREKCFDTSETS
ncbi:MAG: hypothetical protein KDB23_28810, partial [Planctomycetales bacterium]|nr:hypothetical protein [Planctomycetales bacterium]